MMGPISAAYHLFSYSPSVQVEQESLESELNLLARELSVEAPPRPARSPVSAAKTLFSSASKPKSKDPVVTGESRAEIRRSLVGTPVKVDFFPLLARRRGRRGLCRQGSELAPCRPARQSRAARLRHPGGRAPPRADQPDLRQG